MPRVEEETCIAVIRFDHSWYTPEDDVKTILEGLPNLALRSLDVEVFGFTDTKLVDNLIAAAKRGVVIRLMNDRSQAKWPYDKAAIQRLVDAGLPNITVKIVESSHGAIDHLKQIVIDGVDGAMSDTSSVFNGSYNFSAGAERQDNSARLTNDPGLVNQALTKFEHDWVVNEQKPEWQIKPTVVAVPVAGVPAI